MKTENRKTEQKLTSNGTLGNAEENNINLGYSETKPEPSVKSEDIEIYQINNNPFTVIRKEKTWMLMLGNYVLEIVNDLEEGMKKAEEITWNRIVQVALCSSEFQQKETKISYDKTPEKNKSLDL